MESIAALSVASNIIQIVDFSSRIVSRSQEISRSADGRVEEHTILDDAAANLVELLDDVHNMQLPDSRALSTADQRLAILKTETEKVVKRLHGALSKAKLKGNHSRGQSIYQALRSVYKENEILIISDRLNSIRKEVDTALLISLRQELDRAARRQKLDANDSIAPYYAGDVEAKQRHAELLSAISANDWQASRGSDVTGFSQEMSSHAAADLRTRFCQLVLARLYFRQMPARGESIPEAHSSTFNWIFEQDKDQETPSWDSFTAWLREEASTIYWITGKPGSGKSTLMKYLYGHQQIRSLLETWSKHGDMTMAGFYFWNSGSAMQMSLLGLFRTLLYECLQNDMSLILSAFPERWEQFAAVGGGRDPFDWFELKRAFKRIISDHSKKFFFLIDGLDEFEGEPKEIIEVILSAAQPNVKLCIASRPWLPFEDAFGRKPSLLMEKLTQQDISSYINSHFHENEHYLRLSKSDPDNASALLHDIVNKASGVFLWVYLVVQSLLEGLSNSDRISDLQSRLDGLPSDLQALFNRMLRSLQPEYFRHACKIFRIYGTHRESVGILPSLLDLYFADDKDIKSGFKASCSPFEVHDALQYAEDMRRRLNARCKGFLEVTSRRAYGELYDEKVSYLHRTARDFIESEDYWPTILQSTAHDDFKSEERCANAKLWLLKSHPLATTRGPYHLGQCIESVILVQRKTGVVPKTYLDEVFMAYDTLLEKRYERNTMLLEKLAEFARFDELLDYCILAAKTSSPTDRKSALTDRAWEMYVPQSDVRRIRQALKYYNMHPRVRWLRREPKLAPYE